MRLRCVLLFAAAAAIAVCSADATSMSTTVGERDEVGAAANRRLRGIDTADELDDEDSEERGAVDLSKHADEVFKVLKLDDGVEDLLANPIMKEWVADVEKMNKLKPENKVSIFETLIWNYDQATAAKIIGRGARYASTESLANSLRKELIRRWSSANESPAELLKVLKLDEDALPTRLWEY
ncbi:hypothetical protein PHYSODRAFT_288438 [Phytophthora sojae]|uniref:RxLR effector protein n=1 Tax=Phytophthora sojae (strain P6497) TaxID=1094619 RepID=G5A4H5_PHYSP|nr:hypothetical protein PHYSODRAFT_288438 [Phytophthora sojae]EGZ09576.1 hypothetical protein PHYSODRAFT_288438 [Phytophthora sojae]|eukprot:XP_009534437.1 hypothetical protein PHYSODRAFT_288438 [Phytophthora sojae]